MEPPYSLDRATDALAQADPALGRAILRVGPCGLTVRHVQSPFRSLLRAIVYQQLSGKAAGTILGRLLDRFPDRAPTPEALLALDEDAIRAAGLSRAKTAAVRDLARLTLDGTVPSAETLHGLTDAEIVERLTAVRGVGPWTVEMLLIFSLGRPDVLPATDLAIRKGVAVVAGWDELPTPRAVRERAARWAPWRSVASWYLWRASEWAPTGL